MKRFTPLLTLLAGAGMAAALFTMSAQASSANRPAEVPGPAVAPPSPVPPTVDIPPESPPPADPPAADAPATDAPRPADANWTGRLDNGATIAITAADGRAVAYVCDGKRLEIWLQGTAREGKLALDGKDGASLTGTFGAGRASGELVVGDRRWRFTAKATNKPAPVLYRAAEQARNAGVDGGWIVLPDGTQIGVVTWNGTPAPAPSLDPAAGTTTVNGVRIAADPVAADRAGGR